MKQIYHFERHHPPVLNENMLRSEIERRRLRRQMALLAVAGLLLQVAVALFGYSAADWYPWVTVLCFAYLAASAAGCGAVAVAYARKGGSLT